MKIISKFKNSQLVFIDGKTPARIKKVYFEKGNFFYELHKSGEILPEDRLSMIKD
jgi:hypothetical protein